MSSTKRIQFHVTWDKYREADLMAQEKGLTIDNMARTAFFQYLSRNASKDNRVATLRSEGSDD